MNLNSVALIIALAGLAAAASAQPTFTLIDPDAGFDYAVVQDIAKRQGLVLVSLQNSVPRDPLRGYILNIRTGVRTPLADPLGSDLNPIAISGDGLLVAGSLGGGPLADQHAFVWTAGTGVTDIAGLPGGNISYATGVSDNSVVVGTSATNFGDPYQQGWRWTQEEGFTALHDIGDDILTFGSAEDISANGQVVVGTGSIGDFDPDTDDYQYPAAWFNGGDQPTNLGNPPGFPFGGVLPAAASAEGRVIVGTSPGSAPTGNYANRGFRWTQATGFVDIGPLPSRPNGSISISDCSSDGSVLVGYMIDGGVETWESVVWTPSTGVRSLRSIMAAQGVTIPAGIALRESFCNADASIIGGWAYDIPTQRYKGFLATLTAPGCPADFTTDGFVDFFDFSAFVDCFEGQACPPGKTADINADGFVDFLDFGSFVDAFGAGC